MESMRHPPICVSALEKSRKVCNVTTNPVTTLAEDESIDAGFVGLGILRSLKPIASVYLVRAADLNEIGGTHDSLD